MAVSVEKIKELLGNGLSNDVVATAVGVHPSYISQLMSDEIFANEVIALRTRTLTEATSRDRTWDGVEDKLLQKFSDQVNSGMIYKTSDLLRALQVVNNAKRRGNTAQQSAMTHQVTVNLNLPTVVLNKFKKNVFGEVVEVTTSEGEQQTLVTMPASALMQKLTEQHQGKNLNYDHIRKHLPTNIEGAKSG